MSSAVAPSVQPLDTKRARALSDGTEIVVMRRSDSMVVGRFNLVRYAGHYRSGALDAFVVRDENSKMLVRSDRELGLKKDSDHVAYLASDLGTDPSAA